MTRSYETSEIGRLFKYPRTRHIEGSRLQKGDHDLDAVPWSDLRGKRLVIEEKIDGANSAISFEGGELRLQSRGHYLTGGGRERHFALLQDVGRRPRAHVSRAPGESLRDVRRVGLRQAHDLL